MGPNGSGKSTLLKCIAGILPPTDGEIRTVGRLAALLELGAGFHPELTGRENVFLNASILGFSNRQIEQKFDDIVAFSELEQFIDNQVKHYSSGMYVRLGFAVAIHMDPEVLLVDEVLAVGDEAFQRKCMDRVRQFQREGRTIVLVTHNSDAVRQICDRAAVLDHGHLVMLGPPGDAVRVLRETLFAVGEGPPPEEAPSPEQAKRKPNFRVRLLGIELDHPGQAERPHLLPGEPLTMRVTFEARDAVDDAVFGIAIYDDEGREMYGTNSLSLGSGVGVAQGPGVAEFRIDAVPFLDGSFSVTIGVHNLDGGVVYDWWEEKARFQVVNPGRAVGRVDLPLEVHIRQEAVSGEPVPEEAGR